MTEFLGSAAPAQLLVLMALPIISALLLVGFLFFSFSRRTRREKKIEPGTLAKSPPAKAVSTAVSPDLNISVLSSAKIPMTAPGGLSRASPASESNPTLLPVTQISNPDFISAHIEMEALTMPILKRSDDDKIDLAARLGNLQPPKAEPVKPASPLPNVAPSQPVELLRLLRDPQSGQLMVEIAGRRYTRLADIADKEIGQYILKLTAHLLAFTNGMIATEAGVKSVYTPKVGETPLPLVAPRPVSQLPDPAMPAPAPPEIEAAFLASLQAQPIQPEPKPQRKGFFGRAKSSGDEPKLPSLNLAQQINQIVQARLRYSPLAATTKLEIISDPGGGIQIIVNDTAYGSPDDIGDLEVKELIKASIKEWERS